MAHAAPEIEVPHRLPQQAAFLLERALKAGAERFHVSPPAVERRMAVGDVHAWNAFRASLALDVARYLAAIDPLIDEVSLCVSPEPGRRQMVLVVKVRRETPALAVVADAMDQALCEEIKARGLGRFERVIEVRAVGGVGSDGPDTLVVIHGRRGVPIKIWKR
jgi:hypothetical protein